MKKFFDEFKKFIAKGNVLNLAVGVIIGSAFTAIVNSLSNGILKPIINWFLALVLGKSSLSEVYTFLKCVEVDGVVDLTQSIYIDWGALINAIINFFLIAIVLFLIVKFFNKVNGEISELKVYKKVYSKKEIKEFRKQGKSILDIKKLAEEKLENDKKLEEARLAEEKKNAPPTQEQLLTMILEEIKKGNVKE